LEISLFAAGVAYFTGSSDFFVGLIRSTDSTTFDIGVAYKIGDSFYSSTSFSGRFSLTFFKASYTNISSAAYSLILSACSFSIN